MQSKQQDKVKRFPVLLNKQQRLVYSHCPWFVDSHLLDNAHAIEVHGQDLERLAARGGLDPCEIIGNIRRWDWVTIKRFSIYKAVQLLQPLGVSTKD